MDGDDLPITQEWLNTLRPEPIAMVRDVSERKNALHLFMSLNDTLIMDIEDEDTDKYVELVLPHIKTRGQLHVLLLLLAFAEEDDDDE